MRRPRPDLTYKERTAQILNSLTESWQIVRKEPREGFHRLINRVVSLAEECNTEVDYVQDMFFPDRIDLSEEYLVYRVEPYTEPADLTVSGVPLSGVVRLANTTDDLIGGLPDLLVLEHVVSGMPTVTSCVAGDLTSVAGFCSGILYTMDLLAELVVQSGNIENREYASVVATFDRNSHDCAIAMDLRPETIEVTPVVPESSLSAQGVVPSGVPFTVLGQSELTGRWNAAFDIDNNRFIGDYEIAKARILQGTTMSDYTPEQWTLNAWADVNGDGKIDSRDLASIRSAYRSAAPEVKAVVEVSPTLAATCTISFELVTPLPTAVVRNSEYYDVLHDDHAVYAEGVGYAFDSKTEVHYVVSPDRTSLVALRYDASIASVVGNELLYVPRWSTDCIIVDIDVMWGFVFVLVGDGTTYRLYMGDIWAEYTEFVSDYATITLPDGKVPSAMSVSKDGYVVISASGCMLLYRFARDKYLAFDGTTLMNQKRDLVGRDGATVSLIPQYIFNNWDSFAFSFGIDRPWGVTNLQLKRLLFDFYRHPQGHSAIGMANGLYRELGFVNQDTYLSGEPISLPFIINMTGEISINGVVATPTCIDETHYQYETLDGAFILDEGYELYANQALIDTGESFLLNGYAVDGNGDSSAVSCTVYLPRGTAQHVITVGTLGDPAFLEREGLIVSGEATSGLVELVEEYEASNPCIYRNAMTNTIPFDGARFSPSGVVPTAYDPSLSGIVSDDVEVAL